MGLSLPSGGSLRQSPSPGQQEVLGPLMGLMAAMGDRQSRSGDVERGPGGDHGWMDGWMGHAPSSSEPSC